MGKRGTNREEDKRRKERSKEFNIYVPIRKRIYYKNENIYFVTDCIVQGFP
jgi:hypothetical protein